MVVTGIVPYNSKKSKIYIDEQYAFMLYKGEIRRYHLVCGEELVQEQYDELVQEVLLKRCKSRALHLLMSMDRTQSQLRRKLSEGGYPQEVIDETIEYVKNYHYVDDSRYASSYVRMKGQSRSIRQMKAELQQRGISQEMIGQALDTHETDESEAIKRCIQKKHVDMEHITRDELRKLYQFLLRKGFAYENVRRELKLYEISDN